MTLAQVSRTVASIVASLEKMRRSDKKINQMRKEAGQLERVNVDVARSIPQQSESGQTSLIDKQFRVWLASLYCQREQHLKFIS